MKPTDQQLTMPTEIARESATLSGGGKLDAGP
jgi:hypothetical protein